MNALTGALSAFTCLIILGGCSSSSKQKSTTCIDPQKINPEGICTMQYDPVCGCDGKTYSNACMADIAGVTAYTAGPCASGN